jgi:replication-associated recombination protein RarA
MNYPPKTYKDICYASAAVEKLVDDLATNAISFPAHGKSGILIYGPNGTGKSTLAGLLPEPMEQARVGSSPSLVHKFTLQAGANGVALLSHINNIVTSVALNFGHNYIILDEFDIFGPASMASFKSVMNVPNAVFIMTTNNLGAIERGVISRSHLIDMTPPPAAAMLPHVKDIMRQMGVTQALPDAQLLPIITACQGDLRVLLTELERLRNALVKF